jgi:SAM-dependent methyltransferase
MKTNDQTMAIPVALPRDVLPGCPVCGQPTPDSSCLFSVHTISKYNVVKCGRCKLVFTCPRPRPEELDEFYKAAYFRKTCAMSLGYEDYRGLGEINARRMWGVMKAKYLGSRTGGRLLDVGCATGGFLSEASRDGWRCTGVEMSAEAVDIAGREFGLEVLHGGLSTEALGDRRFDVITMWHVLEHMIEPMTALKRACELLVPGGMLFVELPNWKSLGRLLKGAKWSQLKPPEHINFFSPSSLSVAVEKAGLRTILATSAYPSFADRALVRRWSRPAWVAISGIASIASYFGFGGYVRLVAEKSC